MRVDPSLQAQHAAKLPPEDQWAELNSEALGGASCPDPDHLDPHGTQDLGNRYKNPGLCLHLWSWSLHILFFRIHFFIHLLSDLFFPILPNELLLWLSLDAR